MTNSHQVLSRFAVLLRMKMTFSTRLSKYFRQSLHSSIRPECIKTPRTGVGTWLTIGTGDGTKPSDQKLNSEMFNPRIYRSEIFQFFSSRKLSTDRSGSPPFGAYTPQTTGHSEIPLSQNPLSQNPLSQNPFSRLSNDVLSDSVDEMSRQMKTTFKTKTNSTAQDMRSVEVDK